MLMLAVGFVSEESENPLNSRSANQIAAAKYEAWACLSMLRWAWIALRRSVSIASAIARPDGPQAMDDAEIEWDVLSIFYLSLIKCYT